MIVMQHIGMTVLLIGSFCGYALWARQAIGLDLEFVPVFVFSSIACVVYFCGLLGWLLPGSITLLAGGLGYGAVFFARHHKKPARFSFSFSLFDFFWWMGCLFFFLLLLQSTLIHYDNFSHWGIVIKQMLSTDAFPNAQARLIDFKNYPLGVSSFVYYICRFAGKDQAVMILAQALLIFSCFYALFGIITEKKRFLLYAFLGAGCASLSFFNITIRINNLLVDFLLPLYTLALFSLGYRYRKDYKRALIGALPLFALLPILKSTGIIFALIGLLFVGTSLLISKQKVSRGRVLASLGATFVASLVPYLAWSWHVRSVFSQIENKFDLQNTALTKTPEQIQQITALFIRSSADLSTRPALGIVAFHLLAISALLINALFFKKRCRLGKALFALDVVLVLYYGGILGLYIFSMPLEEAIWLAGFERYASSIVTLFAGGLVLTATVDLENAFHYRIGEVPDEQAFQSVSSKESYQKAVLVCMALSVAMLLSEYNGMASINRGYRDTLPYKVKSVTGDRWDLGEADHQKYLCYASDQDSQVTSFYLQYVARYFLYAPQVDGICLFYEDNLENLLRSYDYLVMVESDANAQFLLKKHYGVTGQAGMYRVVKKKGKISLVYEGK